jgi:hypothetical protein
MEIVEQKFLMKNVLIDFDDKLNLGTLREAEEIRSIHGRGSM